MIFPQLIVLAAFASTSRYVVAVPIPDELGLDAGRIAVGERDTDSIYSDSLERRQKGKLCMPLSVEDVKRLPGWAKLESIAKKNWGDGKYELATNPTDYSGRPATVCGQTTPVVIKAGKPSCVVNKSTMSGKITGANGVAKMAVTTGTNFDITTSTTKQASIGTSMTSTISLELPEVAKFEQAFTVSATVTNTIGKQTSTTRSNQKQSGIDVESKNGKTCDLTFEVESCTISGQGSFKYVAEGFVWFNYHSTTKGHYKWSVDITKDLTEAERSSSMDLESLIKTETRGKYAGACTKKGGAADSTKQAGKNGAKTPGKQGGGNKKGGAGGKKGANQGKNAGQGKNRMNGNAGKKAGAGNKGKGNNGKLANQGRKAAAGNKPTQQKEAT